MWEDFTNFYIFINSIITPLEHGLTTFPNLLHFMDSWVIDTKEISVLLVGPKCTPLSS